MDIERELVREIRVQERRSMLAHVGPAYAATLPHLKAALAEVRAAHEAWSKEMRQLRPASSPGKAEGETDGK